MYIRHITMTTGHARDSLPGEVAAPVRAALRPLIRRALTGEHAPVPGNLEPPGCTLTGGAAGRCISLTVWGPPLSPAAFPGAPDSHVPIVEVGIATHSRCGATLWHRLHDLAGRLGITVATDRDRCLGWAWLDEVRKA